MVFLVSAQTLDMLVPFGQRGTCLIEPEFSQCFFSILSLIEFWFLAAVAFDLLSWRHLISDNIVSLIAQTLFEEN